jgi:hypothetical protein
MLNDARLRDKIKVAYETAEANGGTREDQLTFFCGEIAKAIVDEIKELKIIYTGGMTAGPNPVVGTLNHTVT